MRNDEKDRYVGMPLFTAQIADYSSLVASIYRPVRSDRITRQRKLRPQDASELPGETEAGNAGDATMPRDVTVYAASAAQPVGFPWRATQWRRIYGGSRMPIALFGLQ